jgi:hypothetical protein
MNKNKILKGLLCVLSPLALISCGGDDSSKFSIKVEFEKTKSEDIKGISEEDKKKSSCFKVKVTKNSGKEKVEEEKYTCVNSFEELLYFVKGTDVTATLKSVDPDKKLEGKIEITYGAEKEDDYKAVAKALNDLKKLEIEKK